MTDFQEMKQQKEYFEKQYEETVSQYNQMEEAVSFQRKWLIIYFFNNFKFTGWEMIYM